MFEGFVAQLKNMSLGANSGYEYFLALAIFVGSIIVLKIFQSIILARLNTLAKKSKTDFDDTLIEVFKKIRPPFYFFISVYFSFRVLDFPDIVDRIIYILFLVAIVYEVIRALERILSYFVIKYLEKDIDKSNEAALSQARSTARVFQVLIRVILWVVGLLMVLSNLGINVTSLIASLGIGGIAVALALQNVLSDLFSSFSIYMDKPFEVGDFIVVGTERGTVEKIGLKTTRIRSIAGEQIVISNQELTSARIQNFKRLERRREVTTIGVTYETPKTKLEKIPAMLEEIVKSHKKMVTFERCHMSLYADSSINFELVYFVESPEYRTFMDTKQAINLEIFEMFQKNKIEFAYPTQTLYVNKS